MARVYSVIIALLFMSGIAFAFGSAAKTSILQVSENETAVFSLLFWGVNETVTLSVEDRDGLDVSLTEEVLTSRADEMIYASGDYIPVAVAKVYARNVPRGKYNVIIAAKAFGGGGQLAVIQERIFNLTVETREEETSNLAESLQNWFHYNSQEIVNYVYIPLVIIIILIIAFAIYKYS